ncbi:MAG TPA: hypothetical protein DCW46_00215 [Desulfotomaculum sp.]|nr:hypothetical protein [Desulfotomaculum sp.]
MDSNNGNKEQSVMPNLLEIWKKFYYMNESSMAEFLKYTISTDSFAGEINQFLGQYLDFEKMFRKSLDRYFETVQAPSKKDIARVAKLVIGVEDKLDGMEAGLERNLNRLVTNLMIIVDRMAAEKEKKEENIPEIVLIEERLDMLATKIEGLTVQIRVLHDTFSRGIQDRTRKGGASRKVSLLFEGAPEGNQKVASTASASGKDPQQIRETAGKIKEEGDLI